MSDYTSLNWNNITVQVAGSNSKILQQINGRATKGNVHVIMGKGGSGKTTLMNTLVGLVPFEFMTNGSVYLDDSKVPSDFVKHAPFVDLKDVYFDNYTVKNFLWFHSKGKISRKYFHTKLEIYLSKLKIKSLKNVILSKLSSTEVKKVMIINALLSSNKFLMLDDPFSNLDLENILLVMSLISEVTKEESFITVLTIREPISEISSFIDEITFLIKGKQLYTGEINECRKFLTDNGINTSKDGIIIDELFKLSEDNDKISNILQEYSGTVTRSTRSSYFMSWRLSIFVVFSLVYRSVLLDMSNVNLITYFVVASLSFIYLFAASAFIIFIKELVPEYVKDKIATFSIVCLVFMGIKIFVSLFSSLYVPFTINSVIKNRRLLYSEGKRKVFSTLELTSAAILRTFLFYMVNLLVLTFPFIFLKIGVFLALLKYFSLFLLVECIVFFLYGNCFGYFIFGITLLVEVLNIFVFFCLIFRENLGKFVDVLNVTFQVSYCLKHLPEQYLKFFTSTKMTHEIIAPYFEFHKNIPSRNDLFNIFFEDVEERINVAPFVVNAVTKGYAVFFVFLTFNAIWNIRRRIGVPKRYILQKSK
ncbi:hypothetical protein H312_02586 [Anncaliia algerae PRA339]|uniref:ABC transporter domain-containing protein n=1 Tax=Anncaliia algerae PRA339 TaxID=1288291 RepID=A0A059EZ71_9MICR|nr:hypothetical protein H312_02586 [Anncaliia algerae PRA339]